MNQPRKFSEKIALILQKQAEEAKAFENILREVQPLTSGILPEVGTSGQIPHNHAPAVSCEDKMRSLRTKPDACKTTSSGSPFHDNITHNSVRNQIPSSIYSTNTRNCYESSSSSGVHETYRNMADIGSYSNVATMPPMFTNHTGEIFSNLNNSKDLCSSESLTCSSTGKSCFKINDTTNIEQRFPDASTIDFHSQILDFQTDSLVSQTTPEQTTHMAEFDPISTVHTCCYYSTTNNHHRVMSASKTATLQSNSISTTDHLVQDQLIANLLQQI